MISKKKYFRCQVMVSLGILSLPLECSWPERTFRQRAIQPLSPFFFSSTAIASAAPMTPTPMTTTTTLVATAQQQSHRPKQQSTTVSFFSLGFPRNRPLFARLHKQGKLTCVDEIGAICLLWMTSNFFPFCCQVMVSLRILSLPLECSWPERTFGQRAVQPLFSFSPQ